MRSPQPLTNGAVETPLSPLPRIHAAPFHSTVSVRKLQRFNTLILVFRFASFCFSFAAAVFMITNSGGSNSPRWSDFDAFRFVVAANAIVVIYSLFQMGTSIWEIYAGSTLFPEFIQVWFDFGHDQAFAYLLLSASSAGTELGRNLREMDTCMANRAFCVQSGIAVLLGFAGFLLVGLSSMLSGFRVVSLTINGSRFHI